LGGLFYGFGGDGAGKRMVGCVSVYYDTCIHGRPYDDESDPAIARDIADIELVTKLCKARKYPILGSKVVLFEHSKIADAELKGDINKQYQKTIDVNVIITADIAMRAMTLQAEGVGRWDSYHLAAAEAADAEVLLTVDKEFIRIVERKNLSKVLVINPLTFLRKVYLWKK